VRGENIVTVKYVYPVRIIDDSKTGHQFAFVAITSQCVDNDSSDTDCVGGYRCYRLARLS